jgi:ribonuclease Z
MFIAHLINDSFDDPGVYVKFKYRNEAVLFDLGDIHHLSSKEILRIKYAFISHTHMDHFIGFDHLLRICLGRNHHINLFGPPGFIRNVENKIGAYTWNLVENYTNDFVINVVEVQNEFKITSRYHCRNTFTPEPVNPGEVFDGTLVDTPAFSVRGVFLDHKIPSLAFSLEEKAHVNIMKNALIDMGLSTGKWLAEFKDSVMRNDPDDTPIEVKGKNEDAREIARTMPLGVLKERIVTVTKGRKISSVADAVYSEENSKKIVKLTRFSDTMFIEASFLDKDADRASETYHLTAKQAGILARKAGVKNITVFHFSPKYKGYGDLLTEEAERAFRG